jgi:hypothetical protein
MSSASFASRRQRDDDSVSLSAPDETSSKDIFNLIPPRGEDFDRPRFERPYGLYRPVDLDEAKRVEEIDALHAQEIPAEAPSPVSTHDLSAALIAHDNGARLEGDQPPARAGDLPQAPVDLVTTAASGAEPHASHVPPRINDAAVPTPALPTPAVSRPPADAAPGMDLSRLSIDNDGRLYWDGKPVEVRRRVHMSRAQIAGATAIGLLVLIAATGAAIQAAATAHLWGCRMGWIATHCSAPATAPPTARPFDFPA